MRIKWIFLLMMFFYFVGLHALENTQTCRIVTFQFFNNNYLVVPNADERLIDLLRKKSALIKNNTIQITHEEVANAIGTVRVVASRMLKKMERDGLVKLGRNKITLM